MFIENVTYNYLLALDIPSSISLNSLHIHTVSSSLINEHGQYLLPYYALILLGLFPLLLYYQLLLSFLYRFVISTNPTPSCGL